jgi:hypothetical protein
MIGSARYPFRRCIMRLDTMKDEPNAITSDSPGKDAQGDFARFTDFARRILSVPRSEIQRRLEEEKRSKSSASPVPVSGTTSR